MRHRSKVWDEITHSARVSDEDRNQPAQSLLERLLQLRVAADERNLSFVHGADAVQHAFAITRRAGAVRAVARDRRVLEAAGRLLARDAQVEVQVVGAPWVAEAARRFDRLPPEQGREGRDDVPLEREERPVDPEFVRWRRDRPS
jgi:hypothetical protein